MGEVRRELQRRRKRKREKKQKRSSFIADCSCTSPDSSNNRKGSNRRIRKRLHFHLVKCMGRRCIGRWRRRIAPIRSCQGLCQALQVAVTVRYSSACRSLYHLCRWRMQPRMLLPIKPLPPFLLPPPPLAPSYLPPPPASSLQPALWTIAPLVSPLPGAPPIYLPFPPFDFWMVLLVLVDDLLR